MTRFLLVHGSSATLRDRYKNSFINERLSPEEQTWGLIVLDVPEIGVPATCAQLTSASLMADTRVLHLRSLDRLTAAAQNELAVGIRRASEGTFVLLEVVTSSEGRRKTAPVSAELKKAIEVDGEIIEAEVPGERDLPNWIMQEAATRGKTMDRYAARAFVDRSGLNVDAMLSELEKLITYVGPDQQTILPQDVNEIVCGEQQGTVFDLVDAIGLRDADKALSVLSILLPTHAPHGAAMPILAMISRQLRMVWQARAAGAAGIRLEKGGAIPEEFLAKLPAEHNLADSIKGRAFLSKRYIEQARHFTDVQLVRAMARVYDTDLALKGQGDMKMDDRLAMETLIVTLCGFR